MFRKTAKVSTLGLVRAEGGVFRRVAAEGASAPEGVGSRYYADGARAIDFEGVLARVAAKYVISPDPSDYLFEIIRANTTAVPNENHDAFPRSELLAFNLKAGMPVFMTYREKPHHLDHKADNPREARGVIIDAHYADETPALTSCPRCKVATVEPSARTQDGLFCKRCGACVKDEAVEIVVGVDTKKDPDLAEGVRSGILRAGSMGCNCVSTQCHVCAHIAYTPHEFCEHIRQGNKGTYWLRTAVRDDGRGDFRRIEARALEHEFRKRGYVFDLNDFVSLHGDDGLLVLKAHENCQDVFFEEYSRVRQPADPKALQREILHVRASHNTTDADSVDVEALRAESRALIAEARMGTTTARHTAARTAQEGPMTPPQTDKTTTPPETGDAPADAAGAPVGAPAGDTVTVGPLNIPPNYQILVVPSGTAPAQVMGGPAEAGSPTPEETMPNQTGPKTNEELGIMNPMEQPAPASRGAARTPPRARPAPRARTAAPQALPFEGAYRDFQVRVSSEGSATIVSPAGPLMVIRPARTAGANVRTEEARRAFGREVAASLMEKGIFRTAIDMKASFLPKMASITDAAMNDMRSYARTPSTNVAGGGKDHDMRGVSRRSVESATAGHNEQTDMRNVKRRKLTTTLKDGTVDHELGRSSTPGDLSVAGEDRSDRRDSRPSFALGKSDAVGGGHRDMQLSQRGRQAAATAAAPNGDATQQGAPSAATLSDRYQRLYAARLAAAQAEAAEKIAAIEASVIDRTKRALRLAASRRALNIEESPLKAAAFDILTSTREVGRDAASGATLIYDKMDEKLAQHLIEATWREAAQAEVDTLISRAAEILKQSDAYLLDAEKDLARTASTASAAIPMLTAAAQLAPVSEVETHAVALRREAMSGNPVFAASAALPAPEVDAGAGNGRFNRHEIRAALSGTKVNAIKGELGSD